MPGDVAGVPLVGFYGKLPARGDFVRAGLSRDFTDTWDAWLNDVMTRTRNCAGEDWLPAFLEAPVWRFILPPNLCGTRAVLGLMMPSVDRVGRYFPLTFAALADAGDFAAEQADSWLDRCEDAGRAALEQDADPDRIGAMIGAPRMGGPAWRNPMGEWWTGGSVRLPPHRRTSADLPDARVFAMMLGLTGASPCQGSDDPALPMP